MNRSTRIALRSLVASLTIIGSCWFAPSVVADDWPQWRGPTRDGVWHEQNLLKSFPDPQIQLKWKTKISNGYSAPIVADGRVYVTDRVVEPTEVERVLCIDAETGAPIWTKEYACKYRSVGYPDGPRAAVTVSDGLAYSLGTMGHLRCYDAASGDLIWKKDPGVDYDVQEPIWGITSSPPLVDGDLLIVQLGAQPDACIIALDRRTGEERWRALNDQVSYSAPIILEQ